MNNNHNDNHNININQQPQPMPPQVTMLPRNAMLRDRREKWTRMMIGQGRQLLTSFPSWLSRYSLVVYILALGVISTMYSAYNMPWYYMLSGVVAVIVFFLFGSRLAQQTSVLKKRRESNYEKYIFLVAFIPRLLYVFLLYWIYQANYGDAFGFENGDAVYYDDLGAFVAELISKGNFNFHTEIVNWGANDDIADMGYGVYVGFVYWLTGNSIIAVRVLKCVWSSLTVLLLYRLAKRNFEPQTARIAGLFVALWPNFWYYCTCHLKEVEMVFLAVLFVEQADQMLRSRKFTAWKVIPVLLIAAAMFTFRTPLGLVALLSLVFAMVMSSARVVTWGKRIIIGGLAVALIGVVAGNRIQEQAQQLYEQVHEGQQQKNMEWRGQREHGNAFAKYAGASVFAPMILTLPFPTMTRPYDGQEVQQLQNGGNYIKNILSFFTIIALVVLLMSGTWREHLLPLSFMLGYLVVLVFSSFAQSERFHQPVMPFELMFAAYGLSIAVTKKKYKRWFTYWCVLMFIAAIAWNWYKLAGRGLQ